MLSATRKSGVRNPLYSATINGKAKWNEPRLAVPYKGKELSGAALQRQLDAWTEYGVMEPDTAQTISMVAKTSASTLDLRGHVFILIGAGSAMGPFPKLLEYGATVVALDIPGSWGKGTKRPVSGLWKRLSTMAENSPGTLIFPISKRQEDCNDADDNLELYESAGCDLMAEPQRILHWLLNEVLPDYEDSPVTIGNYTYLDSGKHVLLSICADAVIDGVLKARSSSPAQKDMTGVAFLCTPTDAHLVSEAAAKARKANASFLTHPLGKIVETLLQLFSMGKWCRSAARRPLDTADGKGTVQYTNSIIVAQGPNYALAKRLQHFRAVLAFVNGFRVSSNVAPSTATKSVVHNRTFKWAYGGMPFFKPYEIFNEETTNALMAALLVADVQNKNASIKARKANSDKSIKNEPLAVFRSNQLHGGMFRAGYSANSVGVPSVLAYFLGGPVLFAPVFLLLVALVFFGVRSLLF